jgi:hypothetical protein
MLCVNRPLWYTETISVGLMKSENFDCFEGCHEMFVSIKLHELTCYNEVNPLNAEFNPICHLLALLGGATIVVVSRLRVKLCSRRSEKIKSQNRCQIC